MTPDPRISDAAIQAFRRASQDTEERVWATDGGRTLDPISAGTEAGLIAAWDIMVEQWRCNDPNLRTPCNRCPDLPPLADWEIHDHAQTTHPEILTGHGLMYTSTLCANGLCDLFPSRCRQVEKWTGAPCVCACHRAAYLATLGERERHLTAIADLMARRVVRMHRATKPVTSSAEQHDGPTNAGASPHDRTVCSNLHQPHPDMRGFYTCALTAGHASAHASATGKVTWP